MKSENKVCPDAMVALSKNITEAQTVLEYSLHIGKALHFLPRKYEQLTHDNLDCYIDELSFEILKDCESFLNITNFNFFGFAGDFHPTDKNNSAQNEDLSILYSRAPFWEHVFLQDAILFTYDKLRKVIGESYTMSSPERVRMSNYTHCKTPDSPVFDIQYHGLDYLCHSDTGTKPWLSLTTTEYNTIPFLSDQNCKKVENRETPITFTQNAANYKRRITTLTKRINEAGLSIKPLFLSSSDSYKHPEEALSVLEFYDFLVSRVENNDRPSTGILPLLHGHASAKNFTSGDYYKYIDTTHKLLSSVCAKIIDKNHIKYDSATEHHLLTSDRIYLRYQLEKIFAPTTISCMHQNICSTKQQPYSLCEQSSINLLATCLKLPNVFTRQYILQMAIDTITKHYDYNFGDSDFFSRKAAAPGTIMWRSHKMSSYLSNFSKLDIWKERFFNMMNYLVQLAFPIYENYFFCAFWNAIKQSYHGNTDAQIVVKMYKLLQSYLNDTDALSKHFNTEDVITNSSPKLKDFPSDKIIHPIFTPSTANVDTSLYKSCLVAHTLTFKNNPVPDFISLSYLNDISSQLKEQIQNLYILELATSKR